MTTDTKPDEALEYLLRRGIAQGAAQVLRGNYQDLEDVVQDAWVKVLKSKASGVQIDNPFGFGWRAGAWTALSRLGERRDSRLRSPEERIDATQSVEERYPEAFVANEPSPLEQALSRERYDRVSRAIERLPTQQRRCLTLFVQGFKYGEIAARLRLSVVTVKGHILRARQSLKRYVNEAIDGEAGDPGGNTAPFDAKATAVLGAGTVHHLVPQQDTRPQGRRRPHS